MFTLINIRSWWSKSCKVLLVLLFICVAPIVTQVYSGIFYHICHFQNLLLLNQWPKLLDKDINIFSELSGITDYF